MNEAIRRPRNLIRLAVLSGAILVSACGSDSDAMTDSEPSTDTQVDIRTLYFPNGTRVITYSNDGGQFADRLQHCDGLDLTEQTEQYGIYQNGKSGNDITRSVDHPACADGRLDPADFVISTNP